MAIEWHWLDWYSTKAMPRALKDGERYLGYFKDGDYVAIVEYDAVGMCFFDIQKREPLCYPDAWAKVQKPKPQKKGK